MTNNAKFLSICFLFMGIGIALLVTTPNHDAPLHADKVLIPCSIWAESPLPELPANAYTDRCETDDEIISWGE